MIKLKKHLDLLGCHVEDRVTRFTGVVASVTFDLYGCIQAIVNPGVGADGKIGEQQWFDVNRLEVLPLPPVMDRPDFDWSPAAIADGNKGPAERPVGMKA
jgi:hypothetical protein